MYFENMKLICNINIIGKKQQNVSKELESLNFKRERLIQLNQNIN